MKNHKKLSVLASTAICGNDISSSVLYVSALAIAFAGQYAWITLLIVSFVLFLFRKIYGEVVGALPLNGGAYNALLNTTSKSMASFAATLTLLSYMATAVISANEAIHYLHQLIPAIPIIITTIILLSFFGVLTIGGVSESSKVAIGIFLFHLTSFAILSTLIIYFLFANGLETFIENWHLPITGGSITNAIFLGFAASDLRNVDRLYVCLILVRQRGVPHTMGVQTPTGLGTKKQRAKKKTNVCTHDIYIYI